MIKIYRKLTAEQRARNVIFASTLSEYKSEQPDDTIHEVYADDAKRYEKIENLKDDKFFNGSHWHYNIIRS